MKPSETLRKLALMARKNSHAPYSGAKIGAALRMKDGSVFTGCNVENASYGGTVCAERVAIFKAVSEGAAGPIAEICVASDAAEPWPPCGLCRQVLAEFATPETLVVTVNTKKTTKAFRFGDLFPAAFTPSYLKRRK